MRNWNVGWERTQWPGVYVRGGDCRIRARVVDPKSGRLREANRILRGVTAEQAVQQRSSMREELEAKLREPPRRRVDEFGRYWLGVKKAAIDPGTYERYKAALEDHAFKSLGRVQFEDLRGLHIQEWINKELRTGYRASTVKGWFRAFRTMVRDAMDDLALTHDPTRRVCFPVAEERAETNALLPDQLARFLEEMRSRFPQHYPLAATLALTGLRFCHASALRWEDFDRKARVLRVRRRQLRRRVGPVTSVKRAPREYPVSPELMAILEEHREHRRPGRARRRGWMFPTSTGTLRCPNSLHKAWRECLTAAGIHERFTVHGLRRTFVDLARRGQVDAVVTRSLTGHVTMKMHFALFNRRLGREADGGRDDRGATAKW